MSACTFWLLVGACNAIWPNVTFDSTYARVLPWALPAGAFFGVVPGVIAAFLFTGRRLVWSLCFAILSHLTGFAFGVFVAIGAFVWIVVLTAYATSTVLALLVAWLYLHLRYPIPVNRG